MFNSSSPTEEEEARSPTSTTVVPGLRLNSALSCVVLGHEARADGETRSERHADLHERGAQLLKEERLT